MTTDRFVFGTVQLLEKWMSQSLLDRDTLTGLNGKHFAQQIQGFRRGRRKLLAERFGWLVGELLHESLGLVGRYKAQLGIGELTKLFRNDSQLIVHPKTRWNQKY